jgi:hypothetical protein
MSRNTKKIEQALLTKGLVASVSWTPMAKEDADGGIDGFHSDQVQGCAYLDVAGSERRHSGWLGYSLIEALRMLDGIAYFVTTQSVETLFSAYDNLACELGQRLLAKGIDPLDVVRFTPAQLCLHADTSLEEATQVSRLPVAAHLATHTQGVYKHYTLFRAAVALQYPLFFKATHPRLT